MADSPRGLVPKKHSLAAPLSATINPYYKPAGYATAVFIGDPVVKTGTSNTATVFQGAEDYLAGELPEINVAGTGGASTGVVLGKSTRSGNLTTIHSAASTEDVMLVCDDPHVIFQVQEDSDGGDLAATSVGLNADYIFTHAGDTTTGISGAELDSSSAATTAGLAMKVLRLSPEDGNAIGTNAKWLVKVNDHTEMPGVVGL